MSDTLAQKRIDVDSQMAYTTWHRKEACAGEACQVNRFSTTDTRSLYSGPLVNPEYGAT